MGSYLNSLIGYQTVTLPFGVTGSVAGVSATFGQFAYRVSGSVAGSSTAAGSVSLTTVVYGPSLIGYATTSLSDPTIYVSGTVTAASTSFGRLGNGYAASQIGYQSATLVDPGGGGAAFGSSPVGFLTTTLAGPHQSITVMTAVGTVKKVRVLSWDGTNLR